MSSNSNLDHQNLNNNHHNHNPPKTLSTNYSNSLSNSSTSVFSKMPLEDVLEDLASRFILNLPSIELAQIERVCFQVEQAHWFYEDFVRPNSLLNLPSYHLKTFTALFFEKCDFLTTHGAPLAGWDPQTAFDRFLKYKVRVPVCGAIMLNEDATQVLLVRGFKPNSSWSFPRGKINANELPRDCAIREVLEETGFNIEPYLSLQSIWSEDSKSSGIKKIRPSNPTPSGQNLNLSKSNKNSTLHTEGDDHFIEITICEQKLRMYLVTGIPNDTVFETRTRQEIGSIAWFPLTDLPTFNNVDGMIGKKSVNKMINVSSSSTTEPNGQRTTARFYMVVPFVNDMRNWLTNHSLLTPTGQSLETPRGHDYQRSYDHTPQISNHSNHHPNSINYYQSDQNSFNDQAQAVYERFNRLQAYQFSQDDLDLSNPFNLDNRLSSGKKKKRKNQRRKLLKKSFHEDRLIDNLACDLDQQLSTDDDDEKLNNQSPWRDLEEGTRALQNFFFGTSKDEINKVEKSDILLDDPSFNQPNSHLNTQSQTNLEINLSSFNNLDHHQSFSIKTNDLTLQSPNLITLKTDVRHDFPSEIDLEYEKGEPLSEPDTDVVKGYDIATSYASSLSSSYRGPSTQIPSSDERNASALPSQSNQSSTLLSSLLNMTETPKHFNTAQTMYSKHGHLAAPRPQPAPQQVERLLAMLQAPTPGPITSENSTSLLSQLLSSSQKTQVLSKLTPSQERMTISSDLVKQTQIYQDQPILSLDQRRVTSNSGIQQLHSPRAPLPNLPSNHLEPILLQQPNHQHIPQSTTKDDSPRLMGHLNGISPPEPVTPRASNLLDLLMKGHKSSNTTTSNIGHHSFGPQASATMINNDSTGLLLGSTRMPLREDERKEKKDALLRQLQSLASLGFQPSHSSSSTINTHNHDDLTNQSPHHSNYHFQKPIVID